MDRLQDRLLAAHASNDRASLVTLYTEAADMAEEINASCFFLTHAYIFALEMGDPAAEALYRRLKAFDRV